MGWNHGGIEDRAKIIAISCHRSGIKKKELLQAATTLDTTTNQPSATLSKGASTHLSCHLTMLLRFFGQTTSEAEYKSFALLKGRQDRINVGTSTFISALFSGSSAAFSVQQQLSATAITPRRWQARRGASKEDSASSLYGSALFDFYSSTSLSLHHPSTSTCITIALFANMRRPLLFSPTALYPDHGLSAVTCRSLHLPSL
eukprot:scaffold11082_cov74-Skeletonema_dohrnii-CCMP3373.AAC.2